MAEALTNEEIDAMSNVEELRAKLKEQVKKEGGKNTVLLKQEPPYLDECEEYEVWKVKFNVWQAGTAMSDQQQACCIIQGLRDDHKYHKKGLQSLMLKTLTKDQQKSPTTKLVLDFLDAQLSEAQCEYLGT